MSSGFTFLLIVFSLHAQQPETNVNGAIKRCQYKGRNSERYYRRKCRQLYGNSLCCCPCWRISLASATTFPAWQGERDATKFGANCAQAGWGAAPGSIPRALPKIACFSICGDLPVLNREQSCRLWCGSMVAPS